VRIIIRGARRREPIRAPGAGEKMARSWSAIVYGPAYLDRVLRVDAPLLDPALGGPLDRSIEGSIESARLDGPLALRDESGACLTIDPPPDWPGPRGVVRSKGRLVDPGAGPWSRHLCAESWHDDLGGMGAGFARALGGTLVSALGGDDDAMSCAIAALLAREGIDHRPIHLAGHPADWTLLLTSGPHGDKLPIGFRGGHAALGPAHLPDPRSLDATQGPILVVAAGLPNPLTRAILELWTDPEPWNVWMSPAREWVDRCVIRAFAPALRNVRDRADPVASIAKYVDIFACNREEWEAMTDADRTALEAGARIVSITDGPRGAQIRRRSLVTGWAALDIAAFPRAAPPRDTNRAGEAFASALWIDLLDGGYRGASVDLSWLARAGRRAAAAAALVLDRERFGFPAPEEIDAALEAGHVAAPSSGR
jgi:sugar/nucleoside kinase (ribokinase family)